MPDVYPSDLAARVEQLERTVAELQAALGQRQPLTSASQGWLLGNMSIPSVSDGVHIGSSGDEPFFATPSGTKRLPNVAVNVAAPSAISAGSAPGSYSSSHSQALVTDVTNLRTTLAATLSVLKTAGQMQGP